MKLNTYMYEIKFTCHKQYFVGCLLSLKSQDLYRPKVHFRFFTLSEWKRLTGLRKWQLQKKKISSVYFTDATCSDEYFLIHVITGRHYFF